MITSLSTLMVTWWSIVLCLLCYVAVGNVRIGASGSVNLHISHVLTAITTTVSPLVVSTRVRFVAPCVEKMNE